MRRLINLLLFLPFLSFGQWGDVPFYREASFIKNGKIKTIYHKSFFANGQGDITEQYFDAVYRFNKNGYITHEYRVYPNKHVDSVLYQYEKGKLTLEQYFSDRPDAKYYEIHYQYDKKGLLEEKRNTLTGAINSYYYEKNILVQEVFGRKDSDVVTRTFYSKDKGLNKKTTVIDNGNGKKSEEIELSSRDEHGNLTQEMLYSGTTLNNLFFYKNYYLGTRLEGFSQYNQDMQTINFTVAYRYNENNLITYESLKFHKSPPNNHEFSGIKASTYEYYFW